MAYGKPPGVAGLNFNNNSTRRPMPLPGIALLAANTPAKEKHLSLVPEFMLVQLPIK